MLSTIVENADMEGPELWKLEESPFPSMQDPFMPPYHYAEPYSPTQIDVAASPTNNSSAWPSNPEGRKYSSGDHTDDLNCDDYKKATEYGTEDGMSDDSENSIEDLEDYDDDEDEDYDDGDDYEDDDTEYTIDDISVLNSEGDREDVGNHNTESDSKSSSDYSEEVSYKPEAHGYINLCNDLNDIDQEEDIDTDTFGSVQYDDKDYGTTFPQIGQNFVAVQSESTHPYLDDADPIYFYQSRETLPGYRLRIDTDFEGGNNYPWIVANPAPANG